MNIYYNHPTNKQYIKNYCLSVSKLNYELAIFQTYLSNETLIADNHVYLNDHQSQFMSVDVEMYSPYYTCRDHDGLLTTLIPSRKR